MSEPKLSEQLRTLKGHGDVLGLRDDTIAVTRNWMNGTADKVAALEAKETQSEALEDRIRWLKTSIAIARHKLEFREIDAANEVLQDAYYDLAAAQKEQSDETD